MQKSEGDSRKKLLFELVLITIFGVVLFWIIPSLVWIYEIASLTYLFIERRIRHRPYGMLGLKRYGLLGDLKKNLPIIVLVVIGTQFLAVFGSYWLYPPLFLRFQERVVYLQTGSSSFLPIFLLFIMLATFVEELIYRGFIQERLSWFYNDYASIAVGSLLMSYFHYSTGPLPAIVADLLFVFIDSSLYGIIYMRSRNIFAAWIAHMSADLVSLVLLWTLRV
jgi:membrane protease YdiL (CAAX protease family)